MYMSLTLDGMQAIEDRSIEEYCDEISKRKFDGEDLKGTISKRVDVDRYQKVPGTCYLSGDTIKDWLQGSFWDYIDVFLKSENCDTISEYISKEYQLDDLSADDYYDCVTDVCEETEDYWFDNIYPDLCDGYFEEHAEIDYDNW